MVRAALVLMVAAAALASGLAGCAAAPDRGPIAAPEPAWITLDPFVLAEGNFQWHETGGGNAIAYFNLASQAAAHPCVWDGAGGEEVYFNNLRLPVGRASQRMGAWSGNLSIAFDWTEADWVGNALRAAYQAPGLAGWHETQPIERGSTLTVPIRVANGNESGDEADEDAVDGWSVWACLPTDTGDPESPFLGSVQAKAVFAPDPVLESSLVAEPAADGNRTARGGSVLTRPAL